MSTIHAISNTLHQNNTIMEIRDILIQYQNKLKLMWVPSHIGIKGNEVADRAAAFALQAPIHIQQTTTKADTKRFFKHFQSNIRLEKWRNYQHHYKQFNIDGKPTLFPMDCKRI